MKMTLERESVYILDGCKAIPDKEYKDLICETSKGAIVLSTKNGIISTRCLHMNTTALEKVRSHDS